MKKSNVVALLGSGVLAAISIADKLAENADARIERKYKARMMRIEVRRQRRLMRRESRKKRNPSQDSE